MSVRQYIGARYVPRFLGTWNNITQYEALDVVDNGSGTSYIARKNVPAGTPLNNTDFWFIYGASSGAIVSLQSRMDAAENDIDDLESDMILTNKIYKNRRVVVVSDSYGSDSAAYSGYSFFPILESRLTASEFKELFTGQLDGASFGWSNKLYLSVLQNMTISDHNSITDILIVGGFNDLCNYVSAGICTLDDIKAGIANFMTYCKVNYPYAKVTFLPVGMKGGDFPGAKRLEIEANLPKIRDYCIEYGMNIETNAIYTLRFTGSQISDGTHPSLKGQTAIANTVAEYLENGHVDIMRYYSLDPSDVTFETGITGFNGVQWYENLKNDNISLEITNLRLNCNGITIQPQNAGGTPLFRFNNDVIHFIHDSSQIASVITPSVFRSANTNLSADVGLTVTNGVVSIGALNDTPITPIYDLIFRFATKTYNTLIV